MSTVSAPPSASNKKGVDGRNGTSFPQAFSARPPKPLV
jgi:hypothetical protein